MVQIWNLGSPEPNFTLEAHQKGVNCVEYFNGGDRPHLITGSDDQTAKVCNCKAYLEQTNVIKGSCGLNLLCHLSWSSETYLLVYGLVVDRYGTTRLRAVCRHLKVIHTMFQLFVSTQNSLLFWQDQKMVQFAFGMLQHTGETWTWSSQSSFLDGLVNFLFSGLLSPSVLRWVF